MPFPCKYDQKCVNVHQINLYPEDTGVENDIFWPEMGPGFQGKKLFFSFTCPLDKYFAGFGCLNIKFTRPKKIKRCQNRFLHCALYYILCKLSTPDLTKLKKKVLLKMNFTRPVGRVLYEFQSSKAKTYSSQTRGRVKVFALGLENWV